MELRVSELAGPTAAEGEVEIVERKGLGHPDTLCDALAEELSRALCRFYLEHAGRILHHNVDKVLLFGGAARPAFGGGEVLAPCELYLAGRAATECAGESVPLAELAGEGSRAFLRARLHAFDPERHLRVHCLVRPGASELVDVHAHARANDTSVGVGYAPLSELERVVLCVERALTAPERDRAHPALGEDVKVMGVRVGRGLRLTVACAVVGRHCADLAGYLAAKQTIAELAGAAARRESERPLEVEVNAGDAPERGAIYLTVTGTSAEAGDDGQAGRGNRGNGLITPYRPMTMESIAGKNPISHVGKLYNWAAQRITAALVAELPEVSDAECRLVSRIGAPVEAPLADLRLRCRGGARVSTLHDPAAAIVRRQLGAIAENARAFAYGTDLPA
jgi:S-adenosylmethionine synthetase